MLTMTKSKKCLARSVFFFFNDTATTEIYTLSLHDALPILPLGMPAAYIEQESAQQFRTPNAAACGDALRSEEHTSELQSPDHILSRLLLEKKQQIEIITRKVSAVDYVINHQTTKRRNVSSH